MAGNGRVHETDDFCGSDGSQHIEGCGTEASI